MSERSTLDSCPDERGLLVAPYWSLAPRREDRFISGPLLHPSPSYVYSQHTGLLPPTGADSWWHHLTGGRPPTRRLITRLRGRPLPLHGRALPLRGRPLPLRGRPHPLRGRPQLRRGRLHPLRCWPQLRGRPQLRRGRPLLRRGRGGGGGAVQRSPRSPFATPQSG